MSDEPKKPGVTTRASVINAANPKVPPNGNAKIYTVKRPKK